MEVWTRGDQGYQGPEFKVAPSSPVMMGKSWKAAEMGIAVVVVVVGPRTEGFVRLQGFRGRQVKLTFCRTSTLTPGGGGLEPDDKRKSNKKFAGEKRGNWVIGSSLAPLTSWLGTELLSMTIVSLFIIGPKATRIGKGIRWITTGVVVFCSEGYE